MDTAIDRAFICFRIGTPQWIPEERYAELLALFEAHRGVTDEVTFFTSETHPPLPLPVIEERAALLARRLPEARRLGCRAGINVLSTVGHHNENLPHSLQGAYTPMTDIDGRTCSGSFCPNDDALRAYVRRVYEVMAEAGPDYLWIDDDVRLRGHLPIRCGCFCDTCMARFAEESGRRWTREDLQRGFAAGSVSERLGLRRAWLQHNRNTISRLFRLIEETVHRVRPGLPLGFMTGERFFEGYAFAAWAGDLAGTTASEVLWRPGGGFYSDETLAGLVHKAHEVGRQVCLLPSAVRNIQSEIENFPYQRLKKSARTTSLEAAAHIAAGCTGAAYNVLSMYDEPLDEYRPLVAHLRQVRPFHDLLVRTLGRHPLLGLHTGWCIDGQAAAAARQGDWLEPGPPGLSHGNEVAEIGVPVAYAAAHACGALWSSDAVLALSEDEVRAWLGRGVLVDAPALQALDELGYGELTGFRVERYHHADAIEVLTDDPLNAGLVGRRRDGRQSFWPVPAAGLAPTHPTARGLARLVDYAGGEMASCCLGVFENARGGRVCVAGYYPWLFLQSRAKSAQVRRLVRWITRDRLPAFVASFHKANAWVREPEPGRPAAVVLNASLDPADDLTVALRTACPEARVFDMECGETRGTAAAAAGPYRHFVLPPVGAWEMRLVVPAASV